MSYYRYYYDTAFLKLIVGGTLTINSAKYMFTQLHDSLQVPFRQGVRLAKNVFRTDFYNVEVCN